jgi:hypothetical protein
VAERIFASDPASLFYCFHKPPFTRCSTPDYKSPAPGSTLSLAPTIDPSGTSTRRAIHLPSKKQLHHNVPYTQPRMASTTDTSSAQDNPTGPTGSPRRGGNRSRGRGRGGPSGFGEGQEYNPRGRGRGGNQAGRGGRGRGNRDGAENRGERPQERGLGKMPVIQADAAQRIPQIVAPTEAADVSFAPHLFNIKQLLPATIGPVTSAHYD